MADDPDDREDGDGRPLSPGEFDIADDEHVRVLGDNRYLISPDEPIHHNDVADPEPDDHHFIADSERVYDWLSERLASADARYGFDITARFDDTVTGHRLRADDVVTVFDALIYWYASHLDDDMPIEDALGILLLESNIPIRYPTDTVYSLVTAHGLTSEDSIGDLLDAIQGDGRVRFPPE